MDRKCVVIGVCGGIAAYKACELASTLVKKNIDVHVVMTKSAQEFVTPYTFMSLTSNRVITGLFDVPEHFEIEHISLAKKADLFIILPATANIIGKIASGIADDFLTTSVMATKSPVLIAPAMNTGMWTNPVVCENVSKLKRLGYHFVGPESGRLACGDSGAGKLVPISQVVEYADMLLCDKQDLKGKTVLVTAGATAESIDPVRFITNHSTGKMGYEVARAAKQRGAEVVLITGKTSLADPLGVNVIKVTSAISMREEVLKYFPSADIVVKSAAVSDYRPEKVSDEKIKKGDEGITLSLVKNPDILKELGSMKGNKILVGFCMETENLEGYARKKLAEKNLDFIVANSLREEGAGFGTDTNVVTIIDKNNQLQKYPVMSKSEVGHLIFDRISEL